MLSYGQHDSSDKSRRSGLQNASATRTMLQQQQTQCYSNTHSAIAATCPVLQHSPMNRTPNKKTQQQYGSNTAPYPTYFVVEGILY